MRKFLAFIICIIYVLSTNACFAFEELYYLKNADKNAISSQVENILTEENFEIAKKNPIQAISKKNKDNFAYIVFQQSGQNLFYYYESNDKNKKLNKTILKSFKKNNIEYEQSKDSMLLANFGDIIYRSITGQKKVYNFEEPKQQPAVNKVAEKPQSPTTLKGFVGKIGRGEKLDVYLQNSINTATAQKGDIVTAVLKQDWMYKDFVVAPQGSILYGTLSKANPAKMGSRNGSVEFQFNKIVTPQGKTLLLSTEKIAFNVTNDGKFKSVIINTVGMAAVGAVIGLLFAVAFGDSSNIAQGAIIGASVGGGTGLVSSTVAKGVDAEIPAFTDVEAVLDKPVNVILNY